MLTKKFIVIAVETTFLVLVQLCKACFHRKMILICLKVVKNSACFYKWKKI